MALTEEEILQQINVLTKKTSDNPEMTYKASATLNKALNPEYFSGQNTKIVNAINKLAADFEILEKFVKSSAGKSDDVLLDVYTDTNGPIWNETKELMEANTIIEGINLILKGHHQHKIFKITPDDIDKVLTVAQDEHGHINVKPIPLGELGHTAETVKYENEALPEIHNVESAIDYVLNKVDNIQINIDWDAITNRPAISNAIALTDNELQMKAGDEVISSVPITGNEDIDDIISKLDEMM